MAGTSTLGPLDIAHNLLNYTRNPVGFLTRLGHESDDIVRFLSGPITAYLITRPEQIEDVLVDRAWNFTPVGTPPLRQAAPESLVNSTGLLNQRQRDLLAEAYGSEHAQGYASLITRLATEAQDRWTDHQTVDLEREMNRLTIDMFGVMLFGDDERLTPRELAVAMEASDYLSSRSTNLVLGLMQAVPVLPSTSRYRNGLKYLYAATDRRIARRRRSNDQRRDLLAMFMEAGTGTSGLTDREIHDEVVGILTAGNINLPAALTWTWYLLSQHPEAESRLHAELDSVLGGRGPTTADLPHMPYTRSVILESMRLYPPSWLIGRNVLHDIEIGSTPVPAGALLAISPYVVHRDPRLWDDPERFDPGRWTDGAVAQRPTYAYLPFSGGPRGCMGSAIAEFASILLVAALAQRWQFRLKPGHQVHLHPGITLRPRGGLPMELVAREEHQPRAAAHAKTAAQPVGIHGS